MNQQDTFLSHKQSLFVEYYIQTGGNGTAAARAAGYRGNSATLGAVAHENLNKLHVRGEIARRQKEIQERLEISTQAKRESLWKIAKECAKYGEISRAEQLETMPNGSQVKTIRIYYSVFDPVAALKAIRELNRMDGDYAATRNMDSFNRIGT